MNNANFETFFLGEKEKKYQIMGASVVDTLIDEIPNDGKFYALSYEDRAWRLSKRVHGSIEKKEEIKLTTGFTFRHFSMSKNDKKFKIYFPGTLILCPSGFNLEGGTNYSDGSSKVLWLGQNSEIQTVSYSGDINQGVYHPLGCIIQSGIMLFRPSLPTFEFI